MSTQKNAKWSAWQQLKKEPETLIEEVKIDTTTIEIINDDIPPQLPVHESVLESNTSMSDDIINEKSVYTDVKPITKSTSKKKGNINE